MSTLLSSATYPAFADRQLFSIAVTGDDVEYPYPNPLVLLPAEFSWFAACEHEIYIRVAQDLANADVRFELWESAPPVQQEPPEVEGMFVMNVSSGLLAVHEFTAGGSGNEFSIPPNYYYLRLSGYRRGEARTRADQLWREFASDSDPGFDAARSELDGQEFYLAQFWPV